MGSNQSSNVTPKDFFKSQGLDDLEDDATKEQIWEKVAIATEQFELNESGTIQEIGLTEKDLAVGNKLLQALQPGVGEVEAEGGDAINQMLRNFDPASKDFKKEGVNLTYVIGKESDRKLKVVTYNLDSVVTVSDALLASLSTGSALPLGLSKALVYPKVAEYLRGLAKVYENGAEEYNLAEFTVQFVRRNLELKSTNVSAYRFRFSSSDKSEKYWLFGTKSEHGMYVHCKQVTFLATQDVETADMFK